MLTQSGWPLEMPTAESQMSAAERRSAGENS